MAVLPFCYASDQIADFNVLEEVALGKDLTIQGKFIDDLNISDGRVCDFYIEDNTGLLIYRTSSVYTDSLGNFFQRTLISEPRYKRGDAYNLMVVCGDASERIEFTIVQKETAFHGLFWELEYFTSEENTLPVIFILFMLLLMILVPVMIIQYMRGRHT